MPNRLQFEQSPYLLQHRENPVDWRPWGSEAFQTAREEDKPVFLSIGYSTCHWCHVMAQESFEDPETAELMNRLFINIKVDREERPDLVVCLTHRERFAGGGTNQADHRAVGGARLLHLLRVDGGLLDLAAGGELVEAAEHRRLARLAAFSLQRAEDLLDRVGHVYTGMAGPPSTSDTEQPFPGVSCKSTRYSEGNWGFAREKIQSATLAASPSTKPCNS